MLRAWEDNQAVRFPVTALSKHHVLLGMPFCMKESLWSNPSFA